MADCERRPLTEEERARILAARDRGGVCSLCGRALAPDEPVWRRRILTHFGYAGSRNPARKMRKQAPVYWRVLVGRECASPAVLRATAAERPERCLGCGRSVYDGPSASRRTRTFCSTRCDNRYRMARAKEQRQ